MEDIAMHDMIGWKATIEIYAGYYLMWATAILISSASIKYLFFSKSPNTSQDLEQKKQQIDITGLVRKEIRDEKIRVEGKLQKMTP